MNTPKDSATLEIGACEDVYAISNETDRPCPDTPAVDSVDDEALPDTKETDTGDTPQVCRVCAGVKK